MRPRWICDLGQRWFPSRRRPAKNKRPSYIPRLECLEKREVPTITGLVFDDFYYNGTFTTGTTINNSGGGTIAAAQDIGVAGVTVTAYNSSDTAQGTATTAADGTYSLTTTGTGPYRIEFTNLPANWSEGPVGPDSNTTVQYVSTGTASNISLGLVNPQDYVSTTNPTLYTQVYYTGDPHLGGTITLTVGSTPQSYTPNEVDAAAGINNPSNPTLVGYTYSSGAQSSEGTAADYAEGTTTLDVPVSEIGSTFGEAYDPYTSEIFASAFTKRFAAYGPGNGPPAGEAYGTGYNGDPGAIYTISSATGDTINGSMSVTNINTTNLADGDAVSGPGIANGTTITAIDAATNTITLSADATANGTGVSLAFVTLFADITTPTGAALTNFRSSGPDPYTTNTSYITDNGSNPADPSEGWNAVGTTSLGGMDINTAGTQMYVMDLQDRTLDVLGINANGTWNGSIQAICRP